MFGGPYNDTSDVQTFNKFGTCSNCGQPVMKTKHISRGGNNIEEHPWIHIATRSHACQQRS